MKVLKMKDEVRMCADKLSGISKLINPTIEVLERILKLDGGELDCSGVESCKRENIYHI